MKQQCELQYRMGETCGFAPKPHPDHMHLSVDLCTHCAGIERKRRRRLKQEADIRRWEAEDPMMWRNNIRHAREICAVLDREIYDLNSKRISVRNML